MGYAVPPTILTTVAIPNSYGKIEKRAGIEQASHAPVYRT